MAILLSQALLGTIYSIRSLVISNNDILRFPTVSIIYVVCTKSIATSSCFTLATGVCKFHVAILYN